MIRTKSLESLSRNERNFFSRFKAPKIKLPIHGRLPQLQSLGERKDVQRLVECDLKENVERAAKDGFVTDVFANLWREPLEALELEGRSISSMIKDATNTKQLPQSLQSIGARTIEVIDEMMDILQQTRSSIDSSDGTRLGPVDNFDLAIAELMVNEGKLTGTTGTYSKSKQLIFWKMIIQYMSQKRIVPSSIALTLIDLHKRSLGPELQKNHSEQELDQINNIAIIPEILDKSVGTKESDTAKAVDTKPAAIAYTVDES